MNEAETRLLHIDPALKAAGWGVVEGSRIRPEYPITLGRLEGAGKRGKPLTADYVLEYRNTKLAVVEAKAWDKALTEGVAQAKDYAGKLAVRFTYASNGQGLYGIDMVTAVEGEIDQFPSPDDLWKRMFVTQNAWRDRFAAVPFEDKGGVFQGRYYQDIAVERVLAAIAAGQERILLTLATGTGKTFIAFQIAWKLFQSRWNLIDGKSEGERGDQGSRRPRILFLADRNILADQAYNAFLAFPDDALVRIDPADIRKKGKVPKNGSIFFTIFQTFMSGPPKDGHTPDDTVVEGEVEAGKRYEETDFNKIIEIKEREKKRVEVFMAQINQREKTLVFCATQAHALAIRDLINQIKTSTDPNYCHRVTADDGVLGEQWLRDFQDNEKHSPIILTTSQKLSTGVDARNVRNIVLLRPVNSMIEFKQIIGRGSRLFDGKDYFTIYDFVKAHHHFSDPEWDGEPVEPASVPDFVRPEQVEGREVREPTAEYQKRQKIKVTLADGKSRHIQHMVVTSFWHPDGTPMSAQQFMEALFGKLPDFFSDEAELRALWSVPATRKKLLDGLAEKGFGKGQLTEMQRIIDAENSDLFDVLAHVAYALEPLTREERVDRAMAVISQNFNLKQQVFLDFVLSHYVAVGVEELDQAKLTPLLKLKYHDSIADAVADLGKPEEIGKIFSGFQKYLYAEAAA